MTPGLVLGLCRNVYCRRSWVLLLLVFNQIFYHIIKLPVHVFSPLTSEPALGIGKLGSRLGPPIGGGLAQES